MGDKERHDGLTFVIKFFLLKYLADKIPDAEAPTFLGLLAE